MVGEVIIIICEFCEKEHDGSYGSGRFCNKQCASAFSTKAKRKDINEKVSRSLSGRPSWNNAGFKKGFDRRRHVFTESDQIKSKETNRKRLDDIISEKSFEELGKKVRKRLILEEQEYRCNHCGITDWNNKPIVLELEHKDGNNKNNKRENLECICPNCHSQTDTFRGKNIGAYENA